MMNRASSDLLVSIIINNHNYGKFLPRAIESALDQSYRNIEVIVVDDASVDDSKDVIMGFAGRITPIFTEDRVRSRYPSFNQACCIGLGYQASRGEIVCLLDSDDYFSPDKVSRVVQAFLEHPGAVLVQDLFTEVDQHGTATGVIRPKLKQVEAIIDHYLEKNDILDIFAQTSALSFARGYLDRMLPIHEDGWNEVWLDVRLTRPSPLFGEIVFLDIPYTYYRLHGANDSLCLEDRNILFSRLTQMYEYVNSFLLKHRGRVMNPDDNIDYSLLRYEIRPSIRGLVRLNAASLLSGEQSVLRKCDILLHTVLTLVKKRRGSA